MTTPKAGEEADLLGRPGNCPAGWRADGGHGALGPPGLRVIPTTKNHAPPSAASQAPNMATGRRRVMSTMRPPMTVATPGAISSQTRPEVRNQVLSGV